MAQRISSTRERIALLARRYGTGGTKGAIIACMALVAGLAIYGLFGLRGASGVTVSRNEGAALEEPPSTEAEKAGDGDTSAQNEASPARLIVHVDGAVANPGVYVLEGSDERINDAVELAGGLTDDADTTGVNLAAPVADGEKVYVPHEGEEPTQTGEAQAAGTATPEQDTGLVNINTAGPEELTQLNGVGEKTAAAIIEERETNGPFASVDDLMRVSGIGEKKLEKMRGQICV